MRDTGTPVATSLKLQGKMAPEFLWSAVLNEVNRLELESLLVDEQPAAGSRTDIS